MSTRLRTALIAAASVLLGAAVAVAQDYDQKSPSPWSSMLTFLVPVALLLLVWLVMWRKVGLGRGGYRRLIAENQDRMAQIETHLGEISRNLERIASSIERTGR